MIMIKDDVYFMKEAYKEALKAYKKEEIPVGSVVVYEGKIIGRGHNLRDTEKIVTKHAEIIAIEKANKKINNWRLINCILYTTLEPCNMCKEVIKETKIKKVIYGACGKNISTESNIIQIGNKNIISDCESLIINMFRIIREK